MEGWSVIDPAYADTFVQPLLDDPLLGSCQHETLARLLPHLDEKELKAGETLYALGDATGSAWLILAGSVRLHFADGQSQLIEQGVVGEEAGTDLAGRMTTAVAETALRLLEIPLPSLTTLIKSNPDLGTRCYQLLLSRSSHETPLGEPGRKKEVDPGSWREVIGWALTVIGPALILWFGESWGLRENAVVFLAMFCATVVMWVFTLVDEYVPSLFALLAILVLGLAPPEVVLSGFASDTFFLAMSVLGLGTVIVASGLSYRFLLWVLLKLPNHPFWQNSALLVTGILLTPVVPSINGRVALVAPLMGDMAETLRLPRNHADTTRLAITAFTGASLLSAVFLTSKSVNFVIFSLLQPQTQAQFSWLHWTMAAGVVGIVMLLCHFAASTIFLGTREDRHLSRPQLAAQLHLLGRIKGREWAAVFGILPLHARRGDGGYAQGGTALGGADHPVHAAAVRFPAQEGVQGKDRLAFPRLPRRAGRDHGRLQCRRSQCLAGQAARRASAVCCKATLSSSCWRFFGVISVDPSGCADQRHHRDCRGRVHAAWPISTAPTAGWSA